MPDAPDGDLPLLHRFKQRGLRLGGRTVDFVSQNGVRKYRAFHEPPFASTCGAVLLDNFRAGDVGRHQVGRELNAAKREVQCAGECADHQGLCQSGDTLQQAMASAE